MHKICIITHTHLSRNPRVVKEAIILARQGYEVNILNSIYSKSIAADDIKLLNGESILITHISDLSKKNLTAFFDRLFKKIGSLAVKYLGIETCFALGYAPLRYIKISKSMKADLYICHQELPLYVGKQLIKKGYKVGFDIEDWHSEDLSEKARMLRPIKLLKMLEKTALTNGQYCTTTSMALAAQLARYYHAPLPKVLYNSFDFDKDLIHTKNKNHKILKVVWFSLNIGPGRGLVEIISIFKKMSISLEIHLIGEVDEKFKYLLEGIASKKITLIFHELVPADKMCILLSSFDVGLAIELHEPKNREYTITNKFFQYIQCGLPVIASNTLGQQEVFREFKPGIMIDFTDINYAKLEKWLSELNSNKALNARINDMANYYDWKKQAVQLLKIIENAL